jgi:hypothetical protein
MNEKRRARMNVFTSSEDVGEACLLYTFRINKNLIPFPRLSYFLNPSINSKRLYLFCGTH